MRNRPARQMTVTMAARVKVPSTCSAPSLVVVIADASNDIPTTANHDKNSHATANAETPDDYSVVQCFWCHNVNDTTSDQGTYGTPEHLNGDIFFDPRDCSSDGDGGTMWDNLGYGAENNNNRGHCGGGGGGKNCWY